ncbi:T9SS type A sorting domain-containing protein [Bacteroides heparinolyticus]|uniref:T9SS type A sorting domain-containing protein n=1 Tax=Prevotella heparinolytica TaxID=28113 RepID=UPI00359F7474
MKRLYTSKSKVLLLFLLLAAAGAAKAQTHEFAPVGAEWYYSYVNIFTTGYIHIKAVKDTVIDGTECVKLEKQEHGYYMDPWGIGPGLYSVKPRPEYVTNSEDKVYLYRDQTFHLWFDFDAEVGDSWPVPPPDNDNLISDTAGFLIVEARGTEMVNGKELKYIDVIDREGSEWGYGNYFYGQSPYTVRIYERIGPVGCYMFPETHWEADANEGGPFRCYEDEEIGHVSDFPYNCDYINPEYQAVVEQKNDRMEVFPNPVEESVGISMPSNTPFVVKLYDSMGRMIRVLAGKESFLTINLDGLPSGLYFLTCDTETDTFSIKLIKE